jgi:hypothetical protein
MRTLRTNSRVSMKTFLGKGIRLLVGISILVGMRLMPSPVCAYDISGYFCTHDGAEPFEGDVDSDGDIDQGCLDT